MPNEEDTKKAYTRVLKRMMFEKLATKEDGTNILPKPLDTYSDQHINKVLDNFNIKVNWLD